MSRHNKNRRQKRFERREAAAGVSCAKCGFDMALSDVLRLEKAAAADAASHGRTAIVFHVCRKCNQRHWFRNGRFVPLTDAELFQAYVRCPGLLAQSDELIKTIPDDVAVLTCGVNLLDGERS